MRYILIVLVMLNFEVNVYAQDFEVDLSAGISNYFGDLQPSKHYSLKNPKPYFSPSIKYGFNAHLYWRASLSLASVYGADNSSVNDRNLNFSSKIQEFNTGLEYRLINPEKFPITPYAFISIGVFHFDPTTVYNGKVVHLQPLGTEGEGLPQYPEKKMYSLTQFCIPFGGGVKMRVNDNLNIGIEVGIRKLFTDYLDDVSGSYADEQVLLAARGQTAVDLAYRTVNGTYPPGGTVRGNPKQTDWYTFIGFTLGLKLYDPQTGEISLGGLIKSKRGNIGCPR